MNKLKIKEIIERNRANYQFTVRGLALEMGISYSYLYELVYKQFDMSPQQLIETVRMEEAIRMIARGMKLIKIYKRLGYDNIRTFREAFHKRLQMNYTTCRSSFENRTDDKEQEIERYITRLWQSRDN